MELLKKINNMNSSLDKYPEFKEYVGNKTKKEIIDDACDIPHCPTEYKIVDECNCWSLSCPECWSNALKNIDW
jgi:hypothetical protein